MNLFEQYGIKEVADVVLYVITLDKYDNEVYIPVIYFDTLKVSTVEQSAEQSAARGGLGNPNLIIWDYGKEITVNLQDALYTPASQSLIWGGRFNLGKFKIFGAWLEASTGPIFVNKAIDNTNTSTNDVNYINPEDLSLWGTQQKCKGRAVGPKKGPYYMEKFMNAPVKCAELIIENFSDFKITTFTAEDDNNETYIRYMWEGALIKLVVLDGNQQIGYQDNVNICYEEPMYHPNGGELSFFTYENNKIEKKYQQNFYQNTNYNFPREWQAQENLEKPAQKLIGTFYIVEDRNYFNFSRNNMIYPIDFGIKNATKLDRMELAIASQNFVIDAKLNYELYNKSQLKEYSETELKFYLDPVTMKPYEVNCNEFKRANGSVIKGDYTFIKKGTPYYKWTRDINNDYNLGKQILIDSKHYPGNFKLVGETRSRRRDDGIDERLQFEIPLCKMSSNASLQLEAAGDPTVYNFSLKVLRPADGIMMKLTQYNVKKDIITNLAGEKYCSNSTVIVPQEKVINDQSCCVPQKELKSIEIITPIENTVYTVPLDVAIPYNGKEPYLILPESQEQARQWYEEFRMEDKGIKETEEFRKKLLVKLTYYEDDENDEDDKNLTFLTQNLADFYYIEFITGSDGE